jgi:hypothetical protein
MERDCDVCGVTSEYLTRKGTAYGTIYLCNKCLTGERL